MKQYLEALPKPAEVLKTSESTLATAIKAGEGLLAQAERAVITDEASYTSGGDLSSVARKQATRLDEARKTAVKPLNDLVTFINAQMKVPTLDAARALIEGKMLTWKRAEDELKRKEAREEAARIETEALERAAIEQTEESIDEVLEDAAAATEKMVSTAGVGLQRGNYASTGTRKVYSTNVSDTKLFLGALIEHIDGGNAREIDLDALVDFSKGPMNALAKRMREGHVKAMPGATFDVEEKIATY